MSEIKTNNDLNECNSEPIREVIIIHDSNDCYPYVSDGEEDGSSSTVFSDIPNSTEYSDKNGKDPTNRNNGTNKRRRHPQESQCCLIL